MLYAAAEVPSARTISRDVQEVFELTKKEVSRMLQVSSSAAAVRFGPVLEQIVGTKTTTSGSVPNF